MKRLALAAAVFAFVACSKGPDAAPAADTTAAPAAAPAPMADSAAPADSSKMMADTAKH